MKNKTDDRVCLGTTECEEIDYIGQGHFESQMHFNMAVWAHCGKCDLCQED